MDPQLHDAPLYVQTLTWCCAIAVVCVIIYGLYQIGLVAAGDLIDNIACSKGGCE